jgi:hypothetical protein
VNWISFLVAIVWIWGQLDVQKGAVIWDGVN